MATSRIDNEYAITTSSDADRVAFHAADMHGYTTAVLYSNKRYGRHSRKFSLRRWLRRLFRR